MEQCAFNKFCFNIGKSATETFDSIKLAFEGNALLSRCVTFDWYQRFKKGGTFVEDDQCPGRFANIANRRYKCLRVKKKKKGTL